VIVTVHELKRLARNAAELRTLSADLQAGGIQLELLTGIYDPNGIRAMFFAVLAVAGQAERNYIQEKPLEGQVIAAAKGNHGSRPKVIDDDSLSSPSRSRPRRSSPGHRKKADHQDRQEHGQLPVDGPRSTGQSPRPRCKRSRPSRLTAWHCGPSPLGSGTPTSRRRPTKPLFVSACRIRFCSVVRASSQCRHGWPGRCRSGLDQAPPVRPAENRSLPG
jgi:hypothetical protein